MCADNSHNYITFILHLLSMLEKDTFCPVMVHFFPFHKKTIILLAFFLKSATILSVNKKIEEIVQNEIKA